MICEITNRMIDFISYTFDGESDPNMIRDSYGIVDVVMWTIMFVVTLLLLSWWAIPLTKLGLTDIRFSCDKKE